MRLTSRRPMVRASQPDHQRVVSGPVRWLFLASMLLALLANPARAQASAPDWVLPVATLQADPRPPVLELDARGQAHLLWTDVEPQGTRARLRWAAPPDSQPRTVAELPLGERIAALSPQHPGHVLQMTGGLRTAWAVQDGDTRTIVATSLDAQDAEEWQIPPEASLWTFALDPDGSIVSAWVADNALTVHHTGQGITLTLPLEPDWVAQRVQLAINEQGHGYVAWSGMAGRQQNGGVWYAPLAGDATLNQAAPQGLLADMAVGPDGALHLAWFAPEGLYYANNQSPDSRRLVEPRLPSDAPLALDGGSAAVGHLAWLSDGQLWYAASDEWELSRTLLARPAAAWGLDLAVDAWEEPRLLWIESGDNALDARLRLARPLAPAPSVQVTWPLEGQALSGDSIARVAANRPPADWRRIEFYLQEDGPADGQFGALRELGIARDGVDGWQVPLDIDDLDPTRRYRIVALAVGHNQQVIRAVGGWFRVSSPRLLWLWPQPWQAQVSGLTTLAIAPPRGAERLARLDLFLTLEQARARQTNDWPPGPRPPADHYVSLAVEGPLDRPVVRLDTRALSDGTYHLTALGHTADGQVVRGLALHPLTIDNTLAPEMGEVSSERLGAGTDRIEVRAALGPLHRQPERVAFYLQRVEEPSFSAAERAPADLVWAGSGAPVEGGWRATVAPEPYWYDQRWIAWAVACDARDVCALVRAQEPRIPWGTDLPSLMLVQPRAEAPLRGIQPVYLAAGPEFDQVIAAEVWLEHPDGGLTSLGRMSPERRGWSLRWDTSLLPDGAYRLLALASLADGAERPVWSTPLTLANTGPTWRFLAPAAEQVVRGWTAISVAPVFGLHTVERVTLYLRDPLGALATIGPARASQGQWSRAWNTRGTLDGAYWLVAEVTGANGDTWYVEQPVQVHNARPAISLLRAPAAVPVSGVEPIEWDALSPSGEPLTVTIEYSPDAGGHWRPVADGQPGSGSLAWDSATMPDSDAALLRFTATDGVYHSQVTHGPFTVANANDPPTLTLIRPRTGETLCRNAVIAWQATDADGDDVVVSLWVQRGDDPWQLVADGLPGVGRYEWDTTALAPVSGYAVRAMARDPAQANTTDAAEGITIVDNAPPTIELVWPNSPVRLTTETVILWRADDPDGDRLSIDLFYSDNGGLTWFPLAEGVADSGYYVWQIAFLPPGGAYLIKAVASDGHARALDVSDGLITLGADLPPQVQLLAPQVGDALTGVRPIRWWTVGPAPAEIEIDVLARMTVWGEWQPLAEGLSLADTFLWDTRSHSDGEYDLLVRARLGDQRSLSNIVTGLRVQNAPEQPLELELLSPLGGEIWSGLREVRWKLRGGEGRAFTATLELSPDAGATWHPLATAPASSGRYIWQTDDWPAGQRYLLRITVTDGETSVAAVSPGAFSLSSAGLVPPAVTITSPTAAGELAAGELAGGGLITWIAEDVDQDPLLIDIYLSEDAGQSWRQLAAGLLDTGEYAPEAFPTCAPVCLIALVASDGLHRVVAQSAPIGARIAERLRPTVAILSPESDEVASGIVPVAWDASDPTNLPVIVSIAMSQDGGQTWRELATDLDSGGRFDWDTTPLPNGTYLLQVTADNGRLRRSLVSEPIDVVNEGNSPPFLSWAGTGITALQSGAIEVVWRAGDADGDPLALTLEQSLGPHGPWTPLVEGLVNTNSYVWDATTATSVADLWLRLTATDGRFETSIVSEPSRLVHPLGSPLVQLLAPTGDEVWTGERALAWRVTDSGGPGHVVLQRSLDGGHTWVNLGEELPLVGSLLWDTAQAPDGSSVLLRVLATRGAWTGSHTLATPIVVYGNETRDLLPLPHR